MKRKHFALLLASVMGAAAADAADPQSSWARVSPPAETAPKDPVLKRGKVLFHARCQACHGKLPENSRPALFNLPVMPGTWALQNKYRGTLPAMLEERMDLTPEYVAFVVRRGIGSMPFFRPTELSDDELVALSAYLTRKNM
jgi:mono/diheme cytochrome c family protein